MFSPDLDEHLRQLTPPTPERPRRKRRQEKPERPRERGRVTRWHEAGYGFAVAGDADDTVFIGGRELTKADLGVLHRGDLIEFERHGSKKYPGRFEAKNITLLSPTN
jgi:cold shock CspA family protein